MPKYEVQTDTLCDGWVNCWTVTDENGERPDTYDTEAEAQAEIDELIDEADEQIKTGERDEDAGYCQDEFRIVEVPA